MIITCPACSKRYLVDDAAIETAGRRVQCVSCDHDWFFKPTPGAKELEQVHLDLIGIHSSKQSQSGINLGWFLLFITLIALGFGIVMGQSVIQEKLPFTKLIYKSIGLGNQKNTDGLSFQDLRPMVEETKDGRKLMLTGVILNTGNDVKDIDGLSVYIKGDCHAASWWHRFWTVTINRKDASQCVLETWTYIPSETKIYPGERVAFETSAPNVVQGAQSIQVQF